MLRGVGLVVGKPIEKPRRRGDAPGLRVPLGGEPVMGREPITSPCCTPTCVFSAIQVDLNLVPFCRPAPAKLNYFGTGEISRDDFGGEWSAQGKRRWVFLFRFPINAPSGVGLVLVVKLSALVSRCHSRQGPHPPSLEARCLGGVSECSRLQPSVSPTRRALVAGHGFLRCGCSLF